jgi:hypothetical protein
MGVNIAAMLQRLIDWHHRVGWSGTFAVVRDGVSLGLAALGTFLAYLAIKLGKEQAKIAEKQTALAEKQAAITEKQDRIMQDQLAKRAVLQLTIPLTGLHVSGQMYRYPVYVENSGNKTALGLRWNLYIPVEHSRDDECQLEIHDKQRAPFPVGLDERGNEMFVDYSGFFSQPVHRRQAVEIGYLLLKGSIANQFKMYWTVDAEDGSFPEGEAFGEIEPYA